jgi:hypothetical protein
VRATVCAVTALLLLAGCAEKLPTGPSVSGGGGSLGPGTAAANSTEGVLLSSPHLKILGPATVQWNLQNATAEAPQMVATLVYFGMDTPSDLHARDAGIAFAAFIPLDVTESLPGCDATPPSVKHFLRNFGSGGDEDEVGNLTGDYARGWYHFVAIATDAASLSISFDTGKELRPRKLPAADPFVANIQWLSQTGQREYHVDLETKGVNWFAWVQHQIGANGGFGGGGGGGTSAAQVDGGRTHTVGFNGDCAQVSRVGALPTVSTQNEQHRLRTSAAGTAGVTVDAVYAPSQAAAAPQSTFHLAAIAIKDVEIPTPAPAGTPDA